VGSRDQFEHLRDIECMIDDVAWRPFNAKVNLHRLNFILELGALSRAGAVG
jgi:hypothetical protein